RRPDAERHRAKGEDDRPGADPVAGRRGPWHRWRRHRGLRLDWLDRRISVQPCVNPLVDFIADALDQTLGDRRVVRRAEVAVRPRRGADFVADSHDVTLTARRGMEHWG